MQWPNTKQARPGRAVLGTGFLRRERRVKKAGSFFYSSIAFVLEGQEAKGMLLDCVRPSTLRSQAFAAESLARRKLRVATDAPSLSK